MRVLYFGTYDKNYSRNKIMIAGLRAAGAEVLECHVPLWAGTADKVAAARKGIGSVVGRSLRAYSVLLRKYWPLRHSYDVMVLGYAGHFDVFPARVLSWLARKPLVLDIFMSLALIAEERGLAVAQFLYGLEWLAFRLPELLLIDTAGYATWLRQTYGLRHARIGLIPTGADDTVFKPLPPRPPDGTLRVVYYGSFIRNHGVPYIIEAARLLKDNPTIHFELIGDGPERASAEALAKRYALTNIAFLGWMGQKELIDRVANADVCLGAFGQTPQSLMTIQNKIYEGLAMARPVVSGDSLTVRAVLTHGEHIYLVDRVEPRALAEAILRMKVDSALRANCAAMGWRLFSSQFLVSQLGQEYAGMLQAIASVS